MRNRQHSEAEIEQMLTRYLQGSLSNVDKRTLDKYALDDPFLAEAMEGYIDEGIDLRDGELKALREAIVLPQKTAKKMSFHWMKWAAVLFGLAFVGVMGYQLMGNQEDSTNIVSNLPDEETPPIAQVITTEIEEPSLIVQEEVKVEPAAIPITPSKSKKINAGSSQDTGDDNSEASLIDEVEQNNNNQADNIKVRSDIPIQSNTSYSIDGVSVDKSTFDSEKKEDNIPPSPPKVEISEEIAAAAADEEIENAERKRYGNVYIEEKAKTYLPKAKDAKQNKRIVAVKVVDQDGNALIGANIFGGEESALTNFDGYATFEIDTSTKRIKTEYIGYTSNSAYLEDTTSFYRIVLEESAVLDEVVVSELPVPKTISAPEGGWNQFETYADQQLSLVGKTSQSTGRKRGEVLVQFKIKENGDLIEFTVLKSLDPVYDRAVIDMIKSYGKWVSNPPETETVTTFKYIF